VTQAPAARPPTRDHEPAPAPRRRRLPLGPLAGFAAVLAASLTVVLAQPLGAPWWLYADADATYTASGLNLLLGEHTQYLDHPGLPLEEAAAATFGARLAVEQAAGEGPVLAPYVDGLLLDLDGAKDAWRAWAAFIYLAGGVLAFFLVGRLLGHWTWGTAAGLLWVAAPGLVPMSIQFRPDVLLSVLSLVCVFLAARAAQRRDALLFGLAGLALGLTLTVKIHAVGLLAPLALAVAFAPARAGWGADLRSRLARIPRAGRVALAGAALLWLALAVLLNRGRVPFDLTSGQRRIILAGALLLGGYLAASLVAVRYVRGRAVRRILDPFVAFVLLALVAGVLLPATLVLDDGAQMLVSMYDSLRGAGVNQGIEFGSSTQQITDMPRQLAMVAAAVLAGGLALLRRTLWPALFAVGAVAMGVLAYGRLGAIHYYAPAFVLAVPAALWLLTLLPRRRSIAAPLVVWPLVALAIVPTLEAVPRFDDDAARQERIAAWAEGVADRALATNEVALVPSYFPTADGRYFELVDIYVAHTPPYPYRFLPDSQLGFAEAVERGLRPAVYLTSAPVAEPGDLALSAGTFTVEPAPELGGAEGYVAVRIVGGEGVDRPVGHPDARYDPETGWFEGPEGSYWTLKGEAVVDPPKRRYLPDQDVWADAYGDLWDEEGNLVGHDDDYRTVD
jgi:hypothetical protein